MGIKFDSVIIHSLQQEVSTPIISNDCLVLNGDIENFITARLKEVLDSTEHSTGKMKKSELIGMISISDRYKFKELSNMLANKFFNYITNYTTIPDGDLIVTNLEVDGKKLLAILKLNYKQGVYQHALGESIGIISNKNIYDSKIKEAAVINLDTLEITILDKSKEKYIELLFDVDTDLSIDQKISIINQVIEENIEENFERPYEVIAKVKNGILEAIMDNNILNIGDELGKVFENQKEIKEDIISKFESFGLENKGIEIPYSIKKKYSRHKIKTNTGIEVKLATQLVNNPNYFEIITNPSGTMDIVIKNVAEIINK